MLCIKCQYAECHILFNNMLSVIMLSVVMLSVIMLSVVMLSVVMLSVVMLNVVMLSVVMLSVVAPIMWYQIGVTSGITQKRMVIYIHPQSNKSVNCCLFEAMRFLINNKFYF
jgi:hypothetical protein